MQMSMATDNMQVWNVRGLNLVAHCNLFLELVATERISLVCLHETKLDVILDFDVIQILGMSFDYVFLPAVQRGASCWPSVALLGKLVAIVPGRTRFPPRFVQCRVA
jgi:hypothetical protein